MPFVLTTDQKTRVAVEIRDRFGNPASIDGDPRWETSDADVVSITTFDNGRSADVVTAGRLGTAQVTVRCDADLGDGVRELVGVLDVDVVGGEAVMIALTPGPAANKDAAPEPAPEPEPEPAEPEPTPEPEPAPATDEPTPAP